MPAKSASEISGPSPGSIAGPAMHVDALGPMVAGEPIRLLDELTGVGQAVERRGLEQEVGGAVEVGAREDVLLAKHASDRMRAGLRVAELEQRRGDLVAHTVVVRAPDRSVRLAAGEIEGDPSPVETTLVYAEVCSQSIGAVGTATRPWSPSRS